MKNEIFKNNNFLIYETDNTLWFLSSNSSGISGALRVASNGRVGNDFVDESFQALPAVILKSNVKIVD